MTYVEQTWTDNDPSTPLSASRLRHIEEGVKDAHDSIDELPAPFSGAYGDLSDKPTIPTLPALATAGELQAGTVTTSRLVSPKLIHDEIARQIAAITP